jgi:hypothetical protein
MQEYSVVIFNFKYTPQVAQWVQDLGTARVVSDTYLETIYFRNHCDLLAFRLKFSL